MKCIALALLALVAVAQAAPSDIVPYGDPMTCFVQYQEQAKQLYLGVGAFLTDGKNLIDALDAQLKKNCTNDPNLQDLLCRMRIFMNFYRNNKEFKTFVTKATEKVTEVSDLGKKVVDCIRSE